LIKISNNLLAGEERTIRANLKKNIIETGKSLVHDLEKDPWAKFEEVDHRSIQHIIYKNVKYSLGQKPKGAEVLEKPLSHNSTPKFDINNLEVGDYLSSINYFRILDTKGDKALVMNHEGK
jgi:uncharacterized Fe-S cluster protein YjdI